RELLSSSQRGHNSTIKELILTKRELDYKAGGALFYHIKYLPKANHIPHNRTIQALNLLVTCTIS
ncbi:MAG TPA: hypothetical protein VE912_25105, partial [Bacteroidales bacterium]|nr:hypothetical protein [Bacteroidales bacterium]